MNYEQSKPRELIPAGYVAQNGHIFTKREAQEYNFIQKRINKWMEERGYVPSHLLDESCMKFKIITGM